MNRYLIFNLTEKGVVARARLLDDEAPETCRAIWHHLPYEGPCAHAMFSGTSAVLFIDSSIEIPPENTTTHIQTNDVMFTHYDAHVRHGHPEPLSEIYWAYDRYCVPTVPGQLIPVYPNIFGQFVQDSDAFFQACRRISTDGVTPITITGETGE